MKRKLNKVLVANRGEIAVRVLRGAKEMGLQTVAVYSEADAGAPHTTVADEAVLIGPPEAGSSYLDGARIISAARAKGADAIHPGYGFLSENASFAAACRDAGLTFVGPKAETIEALGDKARARQLAIGADVPVIKGAPAPREDAALREVAEEIGYPLMLKASAGGGGKGMRVVRAAGELLDAAGAARREAQSSFGDDTILVERFIERPRHVEIQILADEEGNAVYLGERECSIQRRHQKIIEESPSVIVDEEMRRSMGEAALRVAAAAGYVNAGTVEFLVAPDRSFFFLEVNTRLQVEHPVTELVTGFDLVHEQLAVASGKPLRFSQEDVVIRGHAIECRVYAEDPARGFAPSPGTILRLHEPHAAGLRIDSGIRASQEVPVYYDPILSKVIAWAPTRDEAIRRIVRGLSEYVVLGVKTNIAYLRAVLEHPAFVAGELSTAFVDEHFPSYEESVASRDQAALAAALLSLSRGGQGRGGSSSTASTKDPWDTLDGWRIA